MSRRVSLIRFTPVALASFLAGIAAPRPGVLVHHHPGGEQAHVHLGDDEGLLDHDHGEPHQPHDPLRPGETALEEPDGSDNWHAHIQQPFQSVEPVAFPHITPIETVVIVVAGRPSVDLSRRSLPTRARAPPLLAGS